MDISKPIGDSAYGPFIIRVVIGAYLFIVGLAPMDDIPGFVEGIKKMYHFSDGVSMMIGSTFPYVCMFTGFFLIIGMWTTLTAMFACAVFAFGIYGFGLTPSEYAPFNRDIMVLAGCVSLMYTGAGFFSIDSFRKG